MNNLKKCVIKSKTIALNGLIRLVNIPIIRQHTKSWLIEKRETASNFRLLILVSKEFKYKYGVQWLDRLRLSYKVYSFDLHRRVLNQTEKPKLSLTSMRLQRPTLLLAEQYLGQHISSCAWNITTLKSKWLETIVYLFIICMYIGF